MSTSKPGTAPHLVTELTPKGIKPYVSYNSRPAVVHALRPRQLVMIASFDSATAWRSMANRHESVKS